MPVAFISTRTSPAFGPSRSSSMISSGFFASNATAARVFICHISLKDRAWARVFLSFEFLVRSELPRQSAYSEHHWFAGTRMSIRLCRRSIARLRRTSRQTISIVSFFSAERVAGRGQANVPHFGQKVFLRCGEQNV